MAIGVAVGGMMVEVSPGIGIIVEDAVTVTTGRASDAEGPSSPRAGGGVGPLVGAGAWVVAESPIF